MSWFNQIAEVGYIFSCSRPLLSGFIVCSVHFICALLCVCFHERLAGFRRVSSCSLIFLVLGIAR